MRIGWVALILLLPTVAPAQNEIRITDLHVYPAIILPSAPETLVVQCQIERELLAAVKYFIVTISDLESKKDIEKERVKVLVEGSTISLANGESKIICRNNVARFELSIKEKDRRTMTHLSLVAVGGAGRSNTLKFKFTRPLVH